jgi:hypothetical protein
MGQPRKGNVLNIPPAGVVEVTPTVENILFFYDQATVAELDEGLSWYSDAWALSLALNPTNPRQAAGVIAALSPITPWDRNQALAARAYQDGYASGTLGNSCRNADKILAGVDPLDVLKSDKVRNFFLCIAGDENAVCVDRHAFDVAAGMTTNNDTRAAGLRRKGDYERIAALYREAAALRGTVPAKVQAVTWTVFRRLKGL